MQKTIKALVLFLFISLFTISIIPLGTLFSKTAEVYADVSDDDFDEEAYNALIIARATLIYNQIVDRYGSIEGYINAVAADREYYYNTLNDAGFYNEGYKTACNFTKASMKLYLIWINVANGYEALDKVGKMAFNQVMDEITKDVPTLSTKEFVYDQAKQGLSEVHKDEAFDIAEGVAVDTHAKRISNKLGLSNQKDPEKIEEDLLKQIPKCYLKDVNHLLVWHGRNICTARNPKCENCPINNFCNKWDVNKKNQKKASSKQNPKC